MKEDEIKFWQITYCRTFYERNKNTYSTKCNNIEHRLQELLKVSEVEHAFKQQEIPQFLSMVKFERKGWIVLVHAVF